MAAFIFSLTLVIWLVKAVIDTFEWMGLDKLKFEWKRPASVILSILFCVWFHLSLLAQFGYQFDIYLEIVSYALTGVIVSRGANTVNDIADLLSGKPPKAK